MTNLTPTPQLKVIFPGRIQVASHAQFTRRPINHPIIIHLRKNDHVHPGGI
jgi:hypothetical protein